MLDDISAALSAIETNGAFATNLSCPSKGLRLQVKGVGALRYPVSAEVAWKLKAVASPAPYGLRDQTLIDARVRDTWEIASSQLTIDETAWIPALESKLALIRKRLGLPDGATLEAKLDKMLLYGPGQFFAVHQDSERSGDMIGTLVVQLPTRHEGGELVIEHGGATKVFSGATQDPSELSLLAFYSDCHHEVKPVTFGFRISLTFQLRLVGGSKVNATDANEIVALHRSLDEYFSSPKMGSYSRTPDAPPDRLVYLLDHEYTQHSLVWDRLKNGDNLRASALKHVAGLIDAEVYLTLVDIHEAWSCEDDWDDGYRGRGRRYYDEDDEEDEDGDEDEEHEDGNDPDFELIELIDSQVELHHWVDENGKIAPFGKTEVDQDEVCSTRSSDELTPYKKEHEGYTGNAGNTLDRWYHRAAVVMWPRANNFVIHARLSPSRAIGQIAACLKKGNLDEARSMTERLETIWGGFLASQTTPSAFRSLLVTLDALQDTKLCTGMLTPFGPDALVPDAAPLFARLVERHGHLWAKKLFEAWGERARYGAKTWLSHMPSLCGALHSGGTSGEALAKWLVEREVKAFQKKLLDSLASEFVPEIPLLEEQSKDLLALFEAATVTESLVVRDAFVTFLVGQSATLVPTSIGVFLETCRQAHKPAELKRLGLEPLYLCLLSRLETILAEPPRRGDDWSVIPPKACSCELCKTLKGFLVDPEKRELVWPIAKERRQHIHLQIDRARLPVTHVTLRQGSPQKLVLTKTKALHEQATKRRARQTSLLSWLRKERGSFCAKP